MNPLSRKKRDLNAPPTIKELAKAAMPDDSTY